MSNMIIYYMHYQLKFLQLILHVLVKYINLNIKECCTFFQVTGKCGSVQVRLIPAPRGTGIVGAPVPKKLLQMAGIEDCYTSARGSTGTLGNFGESDKIFEFPKKIINKLFLKKLNFNANFFSSQGNLRGDRQNLRIFDARFVEG